MTKPLRVDRETPSIVRANMLVIRKYEPWLTHLADFFGMPRFCVGMYNIECHLRAADRKHQVEVRAAVIVAVAALQGRLISYLGTHEKVISLGIRPKDSLRANLRRHAEEQKQLLAEWLHGLPEYGNTSVEDYQQLLADLHIRTYRILSSL